MRVLVAFLLLLVACEREPYAPGSFPGAAIPNGPVRTMGCLDATFRPVRDGGLDVLHVDLGNRCWRPTRVDLRALRIQMTDADGATFPLTLDDPRHEVETLTLDTMTHAREHFYLSGGNLARARLVCFDVSHIAPDAPDAHPAPICIPAEGAHG